MAHQTPYILAMFKKPRWREIADDLTFPGLMLVSQLPALYFAIKYQNSLLGVFCVLSIGAIAARLVQIWAQYSRRVARGPALWVDGDDFVVSVDKTVRVPVTEILDYRFVVSNKDRQPVELKLEMRNGKTQYFPLEPLENIAPLVGFMRRLVPGKA